MMKRNRMLDELTDEMLHELLSTDRGIFDAHNYHTQCDSNANFMYNFVNYPNYHTQYRISKEQIDIIESAFHKRQKEELSKANRIGRLTLIANGSQFTPNNKDILDWCVLYTYIEDRLGNIWSVEIGMSYGKKCHCREDMFNIRFHNKADKEDEWNAYKEQCKKLESYFGININIPSKSEKSYHCIDFRCDKPCTAENVLNIINEKLNVNFNELALVPYFLYGVDFVSKSR